MGSVNLKKYQDLQKLIIWLKSKQKLNFYCADKAIYACFAPRRRHNTSMHDGIWLIQEKTKSSDETNFYTSLVEIKTEMKLS